MALWPTLLHRAAHRRRLFPYSDNPQKDPTTGNTDGLQVLAAARGKLLKVIYTNTSAEYWVLQAVLTHTELSSGRDAEVPDNARIYHFAGNQHGSGFPLPFTDQTALATSRASPP